MKRKLFLIITLTLVHLSIIAQDAKPNMFIGRYDKVKKGVCSDRGFVQEQILDYTEYEQRRKMFFEEHKTDNPAAEFVSNKECVIVYEYKKRIAGWNCSPTIIGFKKGPTIENCKEQLASQQAKYPNDFTTSPNYVFTWSGAGDMQKQIITEDFGGMVAKFTLIDKPTGDDFVVAQLSNKTNKTAIVLYRMLDGKVITEYLKPGVTLTKKYDSKSMDIQVLYQDVNRPEPAASWVDFAKDQVRKRLTLENGSMKIGTWDPACMCVRG